MNDKPGLQSLQIEDRTYATLLTRKFLNRRPYAPAQPGKVTCVIPGVIQKVYVTPGETVARNAPLLVLEAMKMQNDILAPSGGKVIAVHAKPGKMVVKGELLVEIE